MIPEDKSSYPARKLSFEEWERQRRKDNPPIDERLKNSRFLVARLLYHTIRYIGIAFIAIGSFLAWLISFLFL